MRRTGKGERGGVIASPPPKKKRLFFRPIISSKDYYFESSLFDNPFQKKKKKKENFIHKESLSLCSETSFNRHSLSFYDCDALSDLAVKRFSLFIVIKLVI